MRKIVSALLLVLIVNIAFCQITDNTNIGSKDSVITKLPVNSLGEYILSTTNNYYSYQDLYSYFSMKSEGSRYFTVNGMRLTNMTDFPILAINSVEYEPFNLNRSNYNTGFPVFNIKTKSGKKKFIVDANSTLSANKLNNRKIEYLFSSPLFKSKASLTFSGNIIMRSELSPKSIPAYVLNDDIKEDITANPLVQYEGGYGTIISSEYLQKDDFSDNVFHNKSDNKAFNFYILLQVPINDNIKLDIQNFTKYDTRRISIFENSLMNQDNNPEQTTFYTSNSLKLTHNLKWNNIDVEQYMQFGYSRYNNVIQDPELKDDFFKYGYIGKFNTNKVRSYNSGEDTIYGMNARFLHEAYRDLSFTFDNSYPYGKPNPELARYTESYYSIYNDPSFYQNSVQVQNGGALLNGQLPDQIYRLYNVPGRRFDQYNKCKLAI